MAFGSTSQVHASLHASTSALLPVLHAYSKLFLNITCTFISLLLRLYLHAIHWYQLKRYPLPFTNMADPMFPSPSTSWNCFLPITTTPVLPRHGAASLQSAPLDPTPQDSTPQHSAASGHTYPSAHARMQYIFERSPAPSNDRRGGSVI